jgi:TonB family protein
VRLAVLTIVLIACRSVPGGPPPDPAPAVAPAPISAETTYDAHLAARDSCQAGQPNDVRPESEVEVPPRAIFARSPGPVYPRDLKNSGVQGDVLVCFVVSATGRVDPDRFVIAASAHPELTRSVRAFLDVVRFEPALIGGAPVQTWMKQVFQFRLAK